MKFTKLDDVVYISIGGNVPAGLTIAACDFIISVYGVLATREVAEVEEVNWKLLIQ